MQTFDELSERLAADPAPSQNSPVLWNPKVHERWQRTQADIAIEWLLMHPAPGPSSSHVERVVSRLGRVWGPYVLDVLYTAGALTADAARLAGPIWGMAEYPEGTGGMSRATWLQVFALAGYTVDGEPAKRPGGTATLYRGAPRSRRFRMAWTDHRATAERFAHGGLRGREPGRVWTAGVDPDRLLARIHEDGRGESEYVVNTLSLRVVVDE
jgi:hypothetical protein